MTDKLLYRIQDYRALQQLDEGVYGKVLHCFKPHSQEAFAVKLIKEGNECAFNAELGMLQHIRALDPAKYNIVKFIDSFVWRTDKCLVFEMLDISLYSMLDKLRVLPLSKIRAIAHQLLVAFGGLKQLGVVHTDLKLDNIMLVDVKFHPLKVKLIDFGLACLKSQLKQGMQVQPRSHQAPEVSLGLPLSEAIDMWSLGCVLVNLFLGVHPFSETPYENQKTIIEVLGFPPNELLSLGIFTTKYYLQQEDGWWRFKTPYEFKRDEGLQPLNVLGPLHGHSLDQAIQLCTQTIQYPESDRMAFQSVCESLLNVDYRKRLTPGTALCHPFITLEYLEEDQSRYANWARDMMTLSKNTNSCGPQEPAAKEDIQKNTQNQCDNEDNPRQEYRTLKTLGEGVYGQVFHCFKTHTFEIVAVKKLKRSNEEAFKREVHMLHLVKQLDLDKYNIVKFIDSFVQHNHMYLTFEMLDISLKDMLAKQGTLKLSEIRPIAQQLLVAFDGLKQLGVVHTDLKLDNVMFVNQKYYPFKVKLIDFGLAHLKSLLKQGLQVQPKAYCAPEVSLGLPLSEAIDMWSLGCVLVYLYLGVNLFTVNPYENQKTIIDTLGFPPNDILSQGIYTEKFYTQNENGQWRLKTPEEIEDKLHLKPLDTKPPLQGLHLYQVILSHSNTIQNTEFRDRLTFLSLCECLLNQDYRKRLTPGTALYHPFITLEYLEEDIDSDYVNWARDIMTTINNNPRGPQEPATKDERKRTVPNQRESLHSSREYDCVYHEDNSLQEPQHKVKSAKVSFNGPQQKAMWVQQQEEEHPCGSRDLEINPQVVGNFSKTIRDPVSVTQHKSTSRRNPGQVTSSLDVAQSSKITDCSDKVIRCLEELKLREES